MSMVEIMPPVLASDAQAWALRINASWRRSLDTYIETGRLLIDAKEHLARHGTWLPLLETMLDFDPSTAQRLMAIARDPRLSNAAHGQYLPRSYRTLYELTKLSDEQFTRGIADRIIRPDMERKEVEILRPTPHRERAEETSAEERAARSTPEGESLLRAGSGRSAPSAGEAPDLANAALSGAASVTPSVGDAASPDHIVDATAMIDAPAAHMAGRVTPAGDLDYSPTPPWATRALVERVLRSAGREAQCKWQTAWEPACGEGHMAEVLREYFREVWATDINARKGYPDCVGGFLPEDGIGSLSGHFDWIITNPPFEDRVLKFMDRALDLAGYGVAMFLQLRYLEGIGRYERIYKDRPPTIVAPFVERVPLVMGRYDPEASTTTAFMWLVWLKGAAPQAPVWIPPGCKAALTRPDDAARFTQSPVQRRAGAPPAEAAE